MRTLLLWLCLSGAAVGQVSVEKIVNVSKTIGAPVQGYTIFEGPPEVQKAGIVAGLPVGAGVLASQDGKPIPTVKLDDTRYLVVTTGSVILMITIVDFDARTFEQRQLVVNIGEDPQPEPDNPDNPDPQPDNPDNPDPDVNPDDIPDDNYGNLGRKVAEWSAGLPANTELGEAYTEAADKLETEPIETVDSVAKWLKNKMDTELPGMDQYTEFFRKLNADIEERWPMAKATVIDYWRVVAAGLGVK